MWMLEGYLELRPAWLINQHWRFLRQPSIIPGSVLCVMCDVLCVLRENRVLVYFICVGRAGTCHRIQTAASGFGSRLPIHTCGLILWVAISLHSFIFIILIFISILILILILVYYIFTFSVSFVSIHAVSYTVVTKDIFQVSIKNILLTYQSISLILFYYLNNKFFILIFLLPTRVIRSQKKFSTSKFFS